MLATQSTGKTGRQPLGHKTVSAACCNLFTSRILHFPHQFTIGTRQKFGFGRHNHYVCITVRQWNGSVPWTPGLSTHTPPA
jgi:hypothetical protein